MKREQDYFSIDNLNELSGVEDHIRFAEQLIDKYSGQAGRGNAAEIKTDDKNCWDIFREQIRQIRKKQNDKKLNISVIGEFSTGKSTFINALLGKELLVSSALQGTTIASTVIDYSDKYKLGIERLDDAREQMQGFPSFESMKKNLSRCSTDGLVAKQLNRVNVYMPAGILKNKIRIIDTPGTNVNEAWHEEVTIRTLKEISDLSVVLISAEKPVSDTMLDFVRRNLRGILSQCVFVVTKLDSIRPRERGRLMDYIKVKLKGELELGEVVVLPYVSPMVLTDKLPDGECEFSKDIIDPDLLEKSYKTEEELLKHTARQRTVAQTKKLIFLIETMYQSIETQMNQISCGYQSKLALLERTRQSDMESFVEKEKVRQTSCFREDTGKIRTDMEEQLSLMAAKANEEILTGLDNKTSIDALKSYINDALGNDCSDKAQTIVIAAESSYVPIRQQFRTRMESFEESFKKLYQELNILPVDMRESRYDLPDSIDVTTMDLRSAASYIAKELSNENRAFGGGAAAGALVGTAILPGAGTVLGAVIGFIGGGIFAPSSQEVRNSCKEKLKPQLKSYYGHVCDSALSSVDQYIDQIEQCLSGEIDKYLETYRKEVEEQIRINEKQSADISAKVNSLRTDMDRIQARKTQLASVIKQLNLMGRRN